MTEYQDQECINKCVTFVLIMHDCVLVYCSTMRRKEGMGRELCVHQSYCRELRSISVTRPRAFKILVSKSKMS